MFMNVVTTNSAEVSELLNSLTNAMTTVILMYLPIIIWSIYRLFRQQTASQHMLRISRSAGLTILLSGMLAVCACHASDPAYRMTRQLFPVNVCHNMISTVDRMDKIAKYHQTSANFTYGASSTHPKGQKEIYVMVIGETSRADNFGIAGYPRNTTPELQQLDNVLLYGKTLSESNTTHKSVPMLLSTLTAENFDSIYFRKSTITAFKEAGYHTAYFSAQKRNHSFIDFFGEEAHDSDFMPDHNDAVCTNDMALIDRMKSFIESSTGKSKLFIVLHTYGSHFRYDDRYSPDNAYFKPDNCAMADKKHRNELINAYDNTIRNVDHTLCSIIEILRQHPDVCTALTYASDHGEDIFDDDRNRFLHASPTPTYWQLHVPLVVWLSDTYINTYPDKASSASLHRDSNVSSSRSLSPTMMDIAGIHYPEFQSSMALSSANYTEPERLYLTDYNEASPLRGAGLKTSDFAMMQKNKISQ